ncbi:DUF6471 domain-containing protein [Azospirillum sp. sgz301742]
MSLNEEQWNEWAKGVLKAEISRRNLTFVEVAERLKTFGIEESGRNVSNKIGRGTFSATFMLQVLTAIGCTTLRIDPPDGTAAPQG